MDELLRRTARLITAARRAGSVPPGPPAKITAAAFMGGLEGLVISVAGRAPDDELLAERAVRGILGVRSAGA
jgi:hypothetical protein